MILSGPRRIRALAATGLVAVALLAGCTSSRAHPRPSASRSSATALPLRLATADARQVVTVTAGSRGASTARLQAWTKGPAGTWQRSGPSIVAHLGRGGLSAHEQENSTATPIGSFTLTQAFGRLRNPGTALPYFRTTPNDWWVSQEGPYYNTHQVCVEQCPFNAGSPNARLFYVTPQYNLAVVIDFNRHPVVQGAGSGVFLHVTRGIPTAGCVSVDQNQLVRIMRWLRPAQHPRILIGVGSA